MKTTTEKIERKKTLEEVIELTNNFPTLPKSHSMTLQEMLDEVRLERMNR